MNTTVPPPSPTLRTFVIRLVAVGVSYLAASAYAQVLPAVSNEGDVFVILADVSTLQTRSWTA